MKKSVTVITSSIGRPELKKCIDSVLNQSYNSTQPIKHMIFINGKKWWDRAKEVFSQYTPLALEHMEIHYLNEETGDCGIGPGYSSVFSAAPWLTNAEYILFLNDDDYYDVNHVESLISHMTKNNLDWAFSLRRFVDKNDHIICDDDFDSLGFWPCVYAETQFLVDNSCFCVKRKLACALGANWHVPSVGDRAFLQGLKNLSRRAGCTGQVTVNYKVGTGEWTPDAEYFENNTKAIHKDYPVEKYPKGFPWRQPCLFIPKELERVGDTRNPQGGEITT